MHFYYSPSFLKVFKKLDSKIQRGVKGTVSKIIDAYASGKKTPGLGIKHLRGPIWEARSGIKIRVVFTVANETLTFVLVGNHNDVKNFLKKA